MHKLLFVYFLLFAITLKVDAKALINKPVVKHIVLKPAAQPNIDSIRLDTSKIKVHAFSAAALDKYKNNPDFDYREADAKTGLNWWQRFWNWFWELIAKLFGNSQPTTAPSFPFMKYIIEGAAVILLVFIIIKLAGLNISNIFNREATEIQVPYSESLENIHQITFEEEIEKALNQRNYRLAIRLLYLSTLKQLNDAHLIQWQLEKTNSAYLNELNDAAQRQSFGILTRQFEYVWYGDFPVDGQSFQNINTLFHDFKMMLK
jgi:hypothetical protein